MPVVISKIYVFFIHLQSRKHGLKRNPWYQVMPVIKRKEHKKCLQHGEPPYSLRSTELNDDSHNYSRQIMTRQNQSECVCVCVCMCECMRVRLCMHTYVCTHTCTRTFQCNASVHSIYSTVLSNIHDQLAETYRYLRPQSRNGWVTWYMPLRAL